MGEEEKKSKGRMERSRMGWGKERFGGGVLSALCICFQDNVHAALLPAGFSKAVHDLSLAHCWTLQTWVVQENKTASQQGVEGKETCRYFALMRMRSFLSQKGSSFLQEPFTWYIKKTIKLLQYFSRGACVSVVHYQDSGNGLAICLLLKLLHRTII